MQAYDILKPQEQHEKVISAHCTICSTKTLVTAVSCRMNMLHFL